ncbi:MAG: hypothetical protein M3285_11350 [Actinomycetota bacterium]|nr:hypothetical protein [Actinomycetota bacterium]
MSAGMWVLVMAVASIHLMLAGLAMVRWARSSRHTNLFESPGGAEGVDDSHARSRETDRRHQRAWRATERRFHEQPHVAIMEADHLATQVLSEKGLDFDGLASGEEVPEVVERYHSAHEVAEAVGRRQAGLRDLEEGMERYRALFDTLFDRRPTSVGSGRPVDNNTGSHLQRRYGRPKYR